jgi:hypothetical protein
MSDRRDPQGSKWRRWDPHLHAPGTRLNNQYRGDDAWEQFLTGVETSDPPIRALGITDYYSVDVYEQVVARKNQSRLAGVDLIFPNIEMRYGIGTGKGSPINVHLLVCPEDPNHVEEIRRFLRAFTFEAAGETFRCDRADLIKLGRAHDGSIVDDQAALAAGTNQFKINPDQLRAEWKRSTWVQENVLVAVAAGSNDGTSGLQGDSSLAALRKEIERFAHVIFSGHPKQREFWIGQGVVSAEQLAAEWGGCNPCLYGSDAHAPESIGAPALDRFCWLKGDVAFETLRQACLEPEYRAFIGPTPPRGALPSQVITEVTLSDAPWLLTPNTPINAGLVGIIGARGSGKTALADIITAGGFALAPHLSERSFIRRAEKLLGASKAELAWEGGERTSNSLHAVELEEFFDSARVQYLSQQFVDTLCSAEGVTDELLAEIERVIDQAHPPEDRMGTTTFRELLDLRATRGRAIRRNHEGALADSAEELNIERERRAGLNTQRKQRENRAAGIEKDKHDRTTLVGRGGEERTAQLDLVSTAAEAKRFQVEQTRRRRQVLTGLQGEVTDTRSTKAPYRLRQLEQAYSEAGLSVGSWKAFLMEFSGNVDGILSTAIADIDRGIRALTGPAPGEVVVAADAPASATSLLPTGVALDTLTLSLLDKEVARLRTLIGIDTHNAKAFARLSEKSSRDEAGLAALDREIALAEKADARIKELIQARRDSYGAVFDGLIEEEKELAELYEPLKTRLEGEEGALGKPRRSGLSSACNSSNQAGSAFRPMPVSRRVSTFQSVPSTGFSAGR